MKIFSLPSSSLLAVLAVAVSIVPQKITAFQQQQRGHLLQQQQQQQRQLIKCASSSSSNSNSKSNSSDQNDNKAMSFLKRIGKVGGKANKDFRFAMGIDEGPAGKTIGSGRSLFKTKDAFTACTELGVVDDLSESFPYTSCGTQWAGVTDRVMGGGSSCMVTRESNFHGRLANVLKGKVSLENNGGFVQMATNLAVYSSSAESTAVDASQFDGIELDVVCETSKDHECFNLHLKNEACTRPFSSYRATFDVPNKDWATVRIPWDHFRGHGPGAVETPFESSSLIRAGVVAIGREMDVTLGLSGFRFYKE